MKIISGNSNLELAQEIAQYTKNSLADTTMTRFSDKEIFVEIGENVRGEDVFLIQSTSFPANDNLMELLVAIDALKRGSAARILLCFPTLVMHAKIVKLALEHRYLPNLLLT